MKQNNNKFFIVIGVTIVTISIIITTSSVFAATTSGDFSKMNYKHNNITKKGAKKILGTVSAINGNILILDSKTINGDSVTETAQYTVDTSNSKIKKIITSTNASSNNVTEVSVSDIKIGDTLMIQGVVNGTSIKATNITDGINNTTHNNRKTIGTVSTINGTTITITKENGFGKTKTADVITYTIDASKAIFNKYTPAEVGSKPTPVLISISDIKIGDTLVVEGTKNETNIVATTITDGSLCEGRLSHKNK